MACGTLKSQANMAVTLSVRSLGTPDQHHGMSQGSLNSKQSYGIDASSGDKDLLLGRPFVLGTLCQFYDFPNCSISLH